MELASLVGQVRLHLAQAIDRLARFLRGQAPPLQAQETGEIISAANVAQATIGAAADPNNAARFSGTIRELPVRTPLCDFVRSRYRVGSSSKRNW